MSIEAGDEIQNSTNNELLQNILIELKKLVSMYSEINDLEITSEDVDDGNN